MGALACKSSVNKMNHIMIAGIENCGKTFFLYSHLKNFIDHSNKIRTRSTDSFNYEQIEIGPHQIAVWDLPGRENLRIFWPNFYRNIDFSGIIYIVDYENKDTLSESVRVMHDLLSEEELQHVNVLVILNYSKKDYDETNKGNKINLEDLDNNADTIELDDQKENIIMDEMKKNIYYHLIPQLSKNITYVDVFGDKGSTGNHKRIREIMLKYISNFD